MDQLKLVWSYIAKYHFWILMSLLLLLAVGSFYVSRSALDQQVTERFGTLDNQFSTVSRLEQAAPTHPNPSTDAEMDKLVEAVRSNVFEAWKKQYERQTPILKWSSDIFDQDSNTLQKVESFRPIEFFLDYPPPTDKGPLLLGAREVYRDYVKNEFKDLAEIVGARWTGTFDGVASGDDENGEPTITVSDEDGNSTTINTGPPPLVTWSSVSQSELQKSIAPWWKPESAPSTLDICYTQESIWVLSAILQVIRDTNAGAIANFQAPIKEIEWIRLGQAAAPPTTDAIALEGGVEMDESAEISDETSVQTIAPDPADNRYVDASLKPVKGAELRQKMKSDSPEDAFFAVAKRIPVRFKVKMDQGKLATLLAECGNGVMMIEVKQVRINSNDQPWSPNLMQLATTGGDGSDGSDGGDGGDGGFSMVSEDGESSQGGDDFGLPPQADSPVEVFGIVYLFNPPDPNKLGIPAAAGEAVVAAAGAE